MFSTVVCNSLLVALKKWIPLHSTAKALEWEGKFKKIITLTHPRYNISSVHFFLSGKIAVNAIGLCPVEVISRCLFWSWFITSKIKFSFQFIVLQIHGNPKLSISKALFNRFRFKFSYSTPCWNLLPIKGNFPHVISHKVSHLQLISLNSSRILSFKQRTTLSIIMTRKRPLLLQFLGNLRIKAQTGAKRKHS